MLFMCDLSEVEGARRGTAPRFRFAQPGVSNVLPLRGRFLILYYRILKYIIPKKIIDSATITIVRYFSSNAWTVNTSSSTSSSFHASNGSPAFSAQR